MSIQTIKHIIIYFLVFIMIIGLTSTFTAKEFIGQARDISLKGEDMLKMQVALNNGNLFKEQDKLENNFQKKDEVIIENHDDDRLDDANREVFEEGDFHEKIMEYQQILFELEYLKDTPEGKFGPMTQKAIIAFQAKENIKETGKLDIETQKALENAEKLSDNDEVKINQEAQEEQDQSPDSTNQGANIEHIVKENETLSSISEKYNISLRDIYQINNLTEASIINIGQKIIIPQY